MKIIEQLNEWVKGNSVHNEESGECCPDFSCCNEKMKTPKVQRELFLKAYKEGDDTVMYAMLGGFLGEAIAGHEKGKNVHIAGSLPEEKLH